MEEFILGMELYFNKTIYPSLLYRLEHEHYEKLFEQQQEGKQSQVYGAEHLLRLFVELPNLVSETNMDTDSLHEVKDLIDELLK